MNRLEVADVPVQSHRPSRAMLEEPATQCLLTWASLAHPDWGFPPTTIDVANALQQSIGDIDPGGEVECLAHCQQRSLVLAPEEEE